MLSIYNQRDFLELSGVEVRAVNGLLPYGNALVHSSAAHSLANGNVSNTPCK